MGVKGMELAPGDEVIGMQLNTQGEALLTITEKGMGKCTLLTEFKPQNRGGKGILCHKLSEKTGKLTGFKIVEFHQEMMLISTEGILIRIKIADISVIGRTTSGVILMNLKDGVQVASVAKVRESEIIAENGEDEYSEEAAEDFQNDSGQTVSKADPEEIG